MARFDRSLFITCNCFVCSLFLFAGHPLWASNDPMPESVTPAPREVSYEWMSLANWYRMHADDVDIDLQEQAQLAFWGDSITDNWATVGKAYWDKNFAPLIAANFGIGGDMTQNLLWRIDHGAVGELKPKGVVLLIGTNNFGFLEDTPAEVAVGVRSVLERLMNAYPRAKFLLMEVFPRDAEPGSVNRQKISELNRLIRSLGEWDRVTCKSINHLFLDDDGYLVQSLMPDYLHPSEEGYVLWGNAIMEWIEQEDVILDSRRVD